MGDGEWRMGDSGSAFVRFGVTGGEFQFELVLGGRREN